MLTLFIISIISVFLFNKKLYSILGLLFSGLFYRLFIIGNNSFNIDSVDLIFISDFTGNNLIRLTILITILILVLRHKVFAFNNSTKLYKLSILRLFLILVLVFACHNIIIFYILFEASLIPTFLLVILWGYQPERVIARFFLLIYTIVRSLPLLFSIFYLFNRQYSFSIINIYTIFNISPIENILFFFICLPFIIKLPVYFFHIWLPKAHVEAPLAGSIILAAILLKLGAIGIIRFSFIVPFLINFRLKIFICLCLIGAIYTRVICTRQTDLKALIAYSSVRHIGTIIAALCTFYTQAWIAAIIILCAHALGSSLLFSLANASYEYSNSRRIVLTKGLLKISPVIRFFWFIGAIIRLGAPPFINFFTEIFITINIIANFKVFTVPFILILFISAVYRLILYTRTSHGNIINFSIKTVKFKFNYVSASFIHFTPGLIYIFLLKIFWF